mgnify:FL=1
MTTRTGKKEQKQRVLDEDDVVGTPQVLAWRMMIESRLKPTTRQLQEWIKEQTAELPSAERKPFPKNQKQKGCRYNDVLIRHLVVTMHDLGFEKYVLLHDKEYVAEQPYAMLWREAVFRGIKPDCG